jgi:hypothetical protein
MTKDAEYWIEKLGLIPHPQGGYYRENYRSALSIARAVQETTGSGRLRRAATAASQGLHPRPARLPLSSQRGRSCLRRRSARNSLAGLVRPDFTSS